MKKICLLLICAAIALNACGGRPNIRDSAGGKSKPGQEVTEVVRADGMSAITNNDIIDAKKRALADAEKNAVEMTVGVYVNAATRVEKAIMVDQQILAKTNGYIKKYKILSEGREGDLYKIRIEALVKIEEVNKDLADLGLKAPPQVATTSLKIAVVIQDRIDGNNDNDGVGENALADKLINLQYKIVSTEELARATKSMQANDLANDTVQQQKVGGLLKADVLIAGYDTAAFNTDQGLGGMVSYRANIAFKVIKIKQAALIYSNSFSSGGVGTTKDSAAKESLKRAAQVAAEDLVRVLDERLRSFNFITVTVKNVADLNQLNSVIKGLQGMVEVKDAQADSFAEGTASIKVASDLANTAVIANKLPSLVKDLNIKVSNVSNAEIDAEIQ